MTESGAPIAIVGLPNLRDVGGWGAASLLMLSALKPIFERFAVAGGDPEMLRPVLACERSI